ncbi:MAG: polyketide cyclase [Sphingobacteriales bacterium]|nr:MAG: polyketide cyclase [Sphingobacteriales bacterium]
MSVENKTPITVNANVGAPVEKVWNYWSDPKHITQWSAASDDWHTPRAENDLRVGGQFSSRMEAKDGSFGFDFGGTYDAVDEHKQIAYTLGDGRKVDIQFTTNGDQTDIVQTFDPESTNPIEMQREGWQAILNNFKRYAEQH